MHANLTLFVAKVELNLHYLIKSARSLFMTLGYNVGYRIFGTTLRYGNLCSYSELCYTLVVGTIGSEKCS